MNSLLPLNSTELERAVEVASVELTEVPLRTLYNPDTCPAHLLYQLAWAWSVDRWDEGWPEAVKRSVIRSSFFIHSRKGTIGALRRVVEPFGYLIEVIEWWQTEPRGVPGTFALKVGVADEGISEETYEELSWLIDDARPVSRHMTGLAISLETRGQINVAPAIYDGDELDVYPPQAIDLVVTGEIGRGGRDHSIDYLDVYHG
ncbi:phage tail protein I [Pseudomonas sp. S 311-6]|uniref:phage tail protein I n=1 Tax=Pseudomonas TaxID=286 RepID=UPI0020983DEC|nr:MULTISPECIES: phage tail protein I [Pseudomonas]MCO7563920.1 phage tail protein I [Pseudomonas mosselii]MCO7615274.1 phage tail protein I [Pseudomonas guariconensis]MCO7636237.1 phage tail protein I [Pseudomonas sp. S 311-6]